MHAAPPVRYPVMPSRLRWAWEGGVFVAALLCITLWAYQTAPSMLRAWVALCLCLPALVFIVRSAWGSDVGELVWDGSTWALHCQMPGGSVWAGDGTAHVVLDLQRVLLLRWHAAGVWGGKWIWLERRGHPSRWHLLRCAVYSRAAHEPSKEPIGP